MSSVQAVRFGGIALDRCPGENSVEGAHEVGYTDASAGPLGDKRKVAVTCSCGWRGPWSAPGDWSSEGRTEAAELWKSRQPRED